MGAYELSWYASIKDRLGHTVGSGVLITPRLVLTCAHVIDDRGLNVRPQGTVLVGFPGLPQTETVPAEVTEVHPVLDVALLSLDRTVTGTEPASLRAAGPTGGRPVRTFSLLQAPGERHTVWTEPLRLLGRSGSLGQRVQMENSRGPGYSRPGSSGSAVVDGDGAVIGLMVAVDDPSIGAARWMLPAEAIAEQVPQVADILVRSVPGRPPARPSARQLTVLVEALLRIDEFTDPGSRELLIELLPPSLNERIRRHSTARLDAVSVIKTCMEHPGGLRELVEVVRALAGDGRAEDFERLVVEATG